MADKKTDDAPQELAAELDTSGWEEQQAVTGRPNDLEIGGKAPANSTFGDRAKTATKAVEGDEAEDKSVRRSLRKKA